MVISSIQSMKNDDTIKNNIILSNKYTKQLDYIKKHHINISTMTLDCKLGTNVNTKLFCQHVEMDPSAIVSVTYSSRTDPFINRKIICTLKKKRPSKKIFYNQSTIIMASHIDIKKYGYMNMKVFKNGALHVTGCKDMQDFYLASDTLVKILNKGTKSIKYVDSVAKITDVSVRMINSNFSKKYKIYRKQLYDILRTKHGINTNNHIPCKFDPTGGHSCVNIKYRYKNRKDISIFVFQTGSIIITGSKYFDQIIAAYKFINSILEKYYNEILIYDYDMNNVNKLLDKYFNTKGKTQQSTIPTKKIGIDMYLI